MGVPAARSRRQTRLTALDLLGFAAADERPQQFVHMGDDEMEAVLTGIKASLLNSLIAYVQLEPGASTSVQMWRVDDYRSASTS